jgi:hypothetical protein
MNEAFEIGFQLGKRAQYTGIGRLLRGAGKAVGMKAERGSRGALGKLYHGAVDVGDDKLDDLLRWLSHQPQNVSNAVRNTWNYEVKPDISQRAHLLRSLFSRNPWR